MLFWSLLGLMVLITGLAFLCIRSGRARCPESDALIAEADFAQNARETSRVLHS